MFVELVEVQVTEIVVADAMGEYVVDRDQDFVCHCHRCPLISASSLETVKLVAEICAFGSCRGIGRLYQSGF